ncbi:hemoglobin/transferrin/lactoferrin receptor protein [Lampropedia hyalina DSM 16112]|jgi:hemoglobin/transferrin/lactoferrin receptor protein|uniref:Hemoglobin/transferrin/lactoferrin receptor protein n=1 Tax=Lampropedia hyalina DSM 16112 TaxID=1122156 RepID=A0A1M4S9L7_9BURK|nr:TonB-dependent receptor [Lampropedia hyalina]SHE28872.1 hemoglobin/transferrin/lactoferrin receptor protein [Lampropedia hyalina DSM 16112]
MHISHAKRGPRRKAGQAPGRPARYTIAQALLVGLLATSLHSAHAQGSEYHIAAQPLDNTLSQIAERHGLQLLAPANLTQGLQAAPVQGRLTLEQAIARALAGSGLTATRSGNTLVVQRHNTEANRPVNHALPEVAVTAAAEVPFGNTASTSTLGGEQLNRFSVTNAGDLFKGMTGVTAANNRTGASLDLNVRGIQGMGRVKILVDGTQSASSDYRGYGGTASHTFVDPELLGGATVSKGPDAGPYGAGATGGVVSLRTLEANDLIQPGNSYGLRLRGTRGNNSSSGSLGGTDGAGNAIPSNNHIASAAGAWKVNERLELVAAVAQRKSGNYSVGGHGGKDNIFPGGSRPVGQWFTIADTPKGTVVDNTSQDARSALLKSTLYLPHEQTLDLGFTSYDNAYGNPRLTMTTEGTPSQHRLSETDKQTYTAKYAWMPDGNPLIDLRANVWGARSEEYRAGGTWGSAHEQISVTRSSGLELWNTSRFAWGWLPRLDVRYGATWLNEKLDITELGTANVAGVNPDGQRDTYSLFAQFEAQPTDWLLLHGGLRRDSYQLKGSKNFTSSIPGQADIITQYDDSDSRINPSIGAAVLPWGEREEFFVRYSEGWRPGSIREVMNSYDPASMPNGPVVPELSKNLEIGTSINAQGLLNANDRAKAGLTFFNTKYENYVIGGLGTFSNIPGVRYRGLELELDYDTGWLFAEYGLTRYLKQQVCNGGILGCTNGEYYASDIELEGINAPPRYQHSFTLGTRLLERKLVLGLRATVVDDRMMPKLNQDGSRNSTAAWTAGWTAYTVYDLFGSYQFNKRLAVNFGVENLRDEYYLEANTPTQLAIPAPGRTAKVTLTYQF